MRKTRTSFSDAIGSNIKKQEDSKRSFGYLNTPQGVKMLKLEDTAQVVDLDFIPYIVTNDNHPDKETEKGFAIKGEPWYRSPYKVHRNVGVDNETVVCPTTFGKRCPICEYRAKRAKQGAEKEEIVELYPRKRSLYALYPNDLPKYDNNEVVVWDMSDELFQNIFNEEAKINPEIKKFVNLEDGVTLTVKFRWKTFGKNKFPEARSIEANPRKDLGEGVLDEAPALDDMIKLLSYEEIEAKFFEEEKEPDGGKLHDEEDTDKPARGSRADKNEEKEERPSRGRAEKAETEDKPTRGERGRKEEADEKPSRGRGSKAETEDKPSRGRSEKEPEQERSRSVRSSSDPECPHGHTFGVDAEKFPEHCDTCKIWGKCLDKKEGK